jgi:hypothetical protein
VLLCLPTLVLAHTNAKPATITASPHIYLMTIPMACAADASYSLHAPPLCSSATADMLDIRRESPDTSKMSDSRAALMLDCCRFLITSDF